MTCRRLFPVFFFLPLFDGGGAFLIHTRGFGVQIMYIFWVQNKANVMLQVQLCNSDLDQNTLDFSFNKNKEINLTSSLLSQSQGDPHWLHPKNVNQHLTNIFVTIPRNSISPVMTSWFLLKTSPAKTLKCAKRWPLHPEKSEVMYLWMTYSSMCWRSHFVFKLHSQTKLGANDGLSFQTHTPLHVWNEMHKNSTQKRWTYLLDPLKISCMAGQCPEKNNHKCCIHE